LVLKFDATECNSLLGSITETCTLGKEIMKEIDSRWPRERGMGHMANAEDDPELHRVSLLSDMMK
jgi:hypothetical protein